MFLSGYEVLATSIRHFCNLPDNGPDCSSVQPIYLLCKTQGLSICSNDEVAYCQITPRLVKQLTNEGQMGLLANDGFLGSQDRQLSDITNACIASIEAFLTTCQP